MDQVRDARWSGMLGFVRQGDLDSPEKDDGGAEQTKVPGISSLGLDNARFQFSAAAARVNPVNDGITDDATAFDILDLGWTIRAEFRHIASMFAPWFDLDPSFGFGEREQTEPLATETVLAAQRIHVGGRFGVDYHPVALVGIGPFLGYRLDLWNANLERIEDETDSSLNTELTDNSFQLDHGPQLGVHARLRTKERVDSLATVYLDPQIVWRSGTVSGVFAAVEAGVGNGNLYLFGFAESRLSAAGRFTETDAPDLSKKFAKSMPIDRRLGGGLSVVF